MKKKNQRQPSNSQMSSFFTYHEPYAIAYKEKIRQFMLLLLFAAAFFCELEMHFWLFLLPRSRLCESECAMCV